MFRRLLVLCCVVTLLGCGGRDGGKIRIAVIPKGTSHQFWSSVRYGAEQAAAEYPNVEIIWKGPIEESKTDEQIEIVRNMITLNVNGICLAPNHSESLVEIVEESIAEEIPVVIFDSGLGEGPDIVSYVATDNFRGGRLAGQRMAEVIGGSGNVILLRYRQGSESTIQREEGFLEELRENFPGITVVSSDQYGDDTAAKSKAKVESLLSDFGEELDGIFAVCESNANGTLEALEDTGYAGRVKFIAFDSSDQLIRALEAGTCHGIVLQDPVEMGYQSVKIMMAHLQGEAPHRTVNTGEYVATPENMNEERISELLHPQKYGQ